MASRTPKKPSLAPTAAAASSTNSALGDPKKKKKNRSVSFALPALPFPLASFLHPLRSASSQWLLLPILLPVAFLFRWAVALGPYSGLAYPPMHGDFEAQRHWMEITIHLPIWQWYWHDLEWWGLDYPPLTAYHSWLCGKIGNTLCSKWFRLYDSRGLDEYGLKVFMRATAVASEFLVYIPAVVIFTRIYGKQSGLSKYDQAVALAAILFQPALMIIDHGHFQYNSVMLGFTLLAVCCFLKDRLILGSLCFVLSLSFKQMALYYAPAVFAYLLGLCVFPRIDIVRLFFLGLTVIASFAAMFVPLFLSGGLKQIGQCLFRIFPFNRGLFEDKVANVWCALNILIKFREVFPPQILQRMSLSLTLLAILPGCMILFLKPKKHLLPLGLSVCAWGFFLFAFQVHEKSVLLPLMPMTLLLGGGLDRDTVSWVTWANTISMFSMWPLLKRDGLILQYLVLTAFYAWLMGGKYFLPREMIGKLIHLGSYAAIAGLHVAEFVVGKPKRYPDLWVVGNVEVCFGCFGLCYLWCLRRLWVESREGKRKTD